MNDFLDLKKEAYEANVEVSERNLALYTWGNVSSFDRDRKVFAIKPSGVPYDILKVEDMVVVDLDNNVIEGILRPSSDTRTHARLYQSFTGILGTR